MVDILFFFRKAYKFKFRSVRSLLNVIKEEYIIGSRNDHVPFPVIS
jgi:hypothetical protein